MMRELLKWERSKGYRCLRELARMYIVLGAGLLGGWTIDDCYGSSTLEDTIM
jgi:hypothetical protein